MSQRAALTAPPASGSMKTIRAGNGAGPADWKGFEACLENSSN